MVETTPFFRLLRMPRNKRIETLLEKISKLELESIQKSLTELLEWSEDLHILVICSNPPKEKGVVSISVIVLDKDYRPIKDSSVNCTSKDGLDLTDMTDDHGVVRFEYKTRRGDSRLIRVNVEKGTIKKGFTANIYHSRTFDPLQILLSVYTDFELYKPGQTIFFRGIAWEKSNKCRPATNMTVYISFLNDEGVKLATRKRLTDEFGVFHGSIPTDLIIPEGTYWFEVSIPELNHTSQKKLHFSEYKRPSIELKINPIESVKIGESLIVSGRAIYFYGDPVIDADCTVQILDSSGFLLIEEHTTLDRDGCIKLSLGTTELSSGIHSANITVKDVVQRTAEYTVSFTLEHDSESQEEVEPVGEWDFSLGTQEVDSIRLEFTGDIQTQSWKQRPIHVFWASRDGAILGSTSFTPDVPGNQSIQIPENCQGLVYLHLIRVNAQGKKTSRTCNVFVPSKENHIRLKVQSPTEAKPGDTIQVNLDVVSKHKKKSLLAGCILVDGAIRELSGGAIPAPFQGLLKTSDSPSPSLHERMSWGDELRRLTNSLDSVLGILIQFMPEEVHESDILYFLNFIKLSKFVPEEFVKFHIDNLVFRLCNTLPEKLVDFLREITADNLGSLISDSKLAEYLVKSPFQFLVTRMLIDDSDESLDKRMLRLSVSILRETVSIYLILNNEKGRRLWERHPDTFVMKSMSTIRKELKDIIDFLEQNGIDTDEFSKRLDSIQYKDLEIGGADSETKDFVVLTFDSDDIHAGLSHQSLPVARIPNLVGYPRYESIMTDVDGGPPNIEPFREPQMDKVETVRTVFSETGYWNPSLKLFDGTVKLEFRIPDTITRQDLHVDVTSKDCDVGSARKSIHVAQEFFVQSDIPRHMTLGDKTTLKATITNRTDESISAWVTINTDCYEIIDPRDVEINVGAGCVEGITWRVQTLVAGETSIEIVANSPKYKDIIRKNVYVHPSGAPMERIRRGKLERSQTFDISITSDEIAHYAFLSLIPDRICMALDGLETMLEYPHGCVEQTMSSVLPNLLVFDYLSQNDRLTERYEALCEDVTTKGLQRLLYFRHQDGGWGWWINDATSMFMTSYVLRGLAKMKDSGFHVPEGLLENIVDLVLSMQKDDGSWIPEGGLRWDRISPRKALTPMVMTCYIVRALLSAGFSPDHPQLNNAKKYILENLSGVEDDPYGLALTWLVLNQLETDIETRRNIIESILKLTSKGHWPSGSAIGGEVESTSLIIQVLYESEVSEYIGNIETSLVWILSQRAGKGGWKTTSDTAAAVEAILGVQSERKTEAKISYQIHDNIQEESIDSSNIEVVFVNLRNIPLTSWLKEGDNPLNITFEGTGEIEYQLTEHIWDKIESVSSEDFEIHRTHSSTELKIGNSLKVQLHVKAKSNTNTFVVIEEPIPSGFKVERELLIRNLGETPNLDHFEIHPEKLLLYPSDCSKFTLEYELVATIPSESFHGATQVYAMYEPQVRSQVTSTKLTVLEKERRTPE